MCILTKMIHKHTTVFVSPLYFKIRTRFGGPLKLNYLESCQIFKESLFCFKFGKSLKLRNKMKICDPNLPTEIWEKILDLLDTSSLLNFQKVCREWRSVVLGYIMNGRLGNRALVNLYSSLPTLNLYRKIIQL